VKVRFEYYAEDIPNEAGTVVPLQVEIEVICRSRYDAATYEINNVTNPDEPLTEYGAHNLSKRDWEYLTRTAQEYADNNAADAYQYHIEGQAWDDAERANDDVE